MADDKPPISGPDDSDCLRNPEPWQKPYEIQYETAARAIRARAVATGEKLRVRFADYRDGPLQEAAYLLDPLFMAASYVPRTAGLEQQVQRRDVFKQDDWHRSEYYFLWHHRELSELNFDLVALRIDRDGLHSAVAAYLKSPTCHTEFLDWYCAETVCYQEWYATVNVLRGQQATAWIGLWAGRRQRKRLAEICGAMRYVYDVLKTGVFSWEVFWLELNSTRELGAAWPGELFRLAELRRLPR